MGKPSVFAFELSTLLKSATFDEMVELGEEMCSAYNAGLTNTDTGVEWAQALNDMASSIIDRTENVTRPIEPVDEPVDMETDENGTGRTEKIVIDATEDTIASDGLRDQNNTVGDMASDQKGFTWS